MGFRKMISSFRFYNLKVGTIMWLRNKANHPLVSILSLTQNPCFELIYLTIPGLGTPGLPWSGSLMFGYPYYGYPRSGYPQYGYPRSRYPRFRYPWSG